MPPKKSNTGTAKDLPTQPWKKGVTYVHVNQTNIQQCNKLRLRALQGEIDMETAIQQMPDAMTVKHEKTNRYGSTVILRDPLTGVELARFEHTPDRPYSCGAQIVLMTQLHVDVISREHPEGYSEESEGVCKVAPQ